MSKRALIWLVVGAWLALAGAVSYFSHSSNSGQTPQPAADPAFAPYHHLYLFANGQFMHAASKGDGAITDLDGHPLVATDDPKYSGCVDLSMGFDPNKNQGFTWKGSSGDPESFSSMSMNMRLVACRNVLPEFENPSGSSSSSGDGNGYYGY